MENPVYEINKYLYNLLNVENFLKIICFYIDIKKHWKSNKTVLKLFFVRHFLFHYIFNSIKFIVFYSYIPKLNYYDVFNLNI